MEKNITLKMLRNINNKHTNSPKNLVCSLKLLHINIIEVLHSSGKMGGVVHFQLQNHFKKEIPFHTFHKHFILLEM